MNKLAVILFLLLTVFSVRAQSADLFTRSGNYFVVAGVLLIILCGLFIYLIRLDMRLRKSEKSKES